MTVATEDQLNQRVQEIMNDTPVARVKARWAAELIEEYVAELGLADVTLTAENLESMPVGSEIQIDDAIYVRDYYSRLADAKCWVNVKSGENHFSDASLLLGAQKVRLLRWGYSLVLGRSDV